MRYVRAMTLGIGLTAALFVSGSTGDALAAAPYGKIEQIHLEGGVIPINRVFDTDIDVVLKVGRWPDEGYRVFLGRPIRYNDETERWESVGTPARAKVELNDNDDGSEHNISFTLYDGYALLAGSRPYGGVDSDTGASEGSAWIMRVVDNDTRHFYERMTRFFDRELAD